jgi:hypothetical protein
MAQQLVDGLSKPFAPEEYPNQTRAALLEFLEAKAAGTEIAEPEEAESPAPVIDLMAALKASLAAAGGGDAAGADEDAPPAKKPAARSRAKAKPAAKGDDQLDIEQGRLRKVEGGGEDAKEAAAAPKKKAPAKRRKAS